AATRLPGQLLWLTADADLLGADAGHRRVGLLARFRVAGPLPAAGVVARGTFDLGDEVQIVADTTGDADCRPRAGPLTAQVLDSASYYLAARQLALLDSFPAIAHVRGDTTIGG